MADSTQQFAAGDDAGPRAGTGAHPRHDAAHPEDYAAGIELHTATLAALKRGDPGEIEQKMYRHLGHFEATVADVLQRTPHRQTPAFLLAGAH